MPLLKIAVDAPVSQLRLKSVKRHDARSAFESVCVEMELDAAVSGFKDLNTEGLAGPLTICGDNTSGARHLSGCEADRPARLGDKRNELGLQSILPSCHKSLCHGSDACSVICGHKCLEPRVQRTRFPARDLKSRKRGK